MKSEREEYISIRPGPGTCCPEMRVKNGVCQGCGHVYKLQEKKEQEASK